MHKNVSLIPLFLSAALCAAQQAPAIVGAVAKVGPVAPAETKSLDRHKRAVKIADAGGGFLGTLELSGFSLKDLLEGRGVVKEDDGFNRPLDMIVTVRGKGGALAVFSFGEVFLAGDEGVLLADGARMILPTHHPPLEDPENDPTTAVLDLKSRAGIDLGGCASCHDGEACQALYFPTGWVLTSARDGFGGRFVENPAEIAVRQVGVKVEGKRDLSREAVVELPSIVGPDGKTHPFSAAEYKKQPRITMADAGIGQGKGYRGISSWEGAPLKNMLRHLLPKGHDPKNTYVLVTAADGYRSTFSGTEVFWSSDERCVLLVDKKNGRALGRGQGLYMVMPRADFFVDRSVRMVAEIRLVLVK